MGIRVDAQQIENRAQSKVGMLGWLNILNPATNPVSIIKSRDLILANPRPHAYCPETNGYLIIIKE